MKTTEIYMPLMREAEGHWYWPGSTSPATLLALALLLAAFVYGYRYPAMKADEAIQRIEAVNQLIDQSAQHTQTALSRLQGLMADQPEWLRQVATAQTTELQAQLSLVKPLSKEQILQKAVVQQEQYDQAQQVIAASPFKGLTKLQIPLSAEGKRYLDALEVKRPSRFEYQRLSDGLLDALPVLQEVFKLQAQTENMVHRLDVQLNGDKAGVPGPAAEQASDYESGEQLYERQQPEPKAPIDELSSAIRKAERSAEQQKQQAKLEAQNQASQAERDARQAELQAEREQHKAQRLSIQRQRDIERQASVAAEATRRAEQDSERRLAAAKRQSEAAAEAKQRECTASIMARARCAAQGYNPLTGARN
ncbi:hypothetical protein SAMN05216596_107149 [Pseudomonas congelans]|uniref:Uncharacterized protein n=1 Tax=Pseudomonas congelans TaxID=200452 RepID=A0A0P9MGR7_9PSED|nr:MULTISPECIES: hypothetical protein [Pseudomonas]KPW87640.1 Unknown protein sequence [Pseudomonas congelans]SDP72016.1 hypothetical protein SAMN05216596_107149 [Pseudomonas congelans]